eukprot:4108289-Pyramimonas_sp.AAC.1
MQLWCRPRRMMRGDCHVLKINLRIGMGMPQARRRPLHQNQQAIIVLADLGLTARSLQPRQIERATACQGAPVRAAQLLVKAIE